MAYPDQSYNLRIELDTKNCQLSAEEIERMEQALTPLRRSAKAFPVSDLYITVIHHHRTGVYHVKTSLILTGQTLFTGERHQNRYSAFERCIDKLVRKTSAYKSSLDQAPQQSKQTKGTHQEVIADQLPDPQALLAAVDEGDYAAFRRATLMYEEPVRKRIGRWIQRYPELVDGEGQTIALADIVEDVFLTAFEDFPRKPQEVPAGDWLAGLIDPTIRNILEHPEEELQNISMARSMYDPDQDPGE